MKIGRQILLISFFEGAAVMATELCGSKLLSPYYGSSLYVWAAVIAVSLGSLAAGYFYGGQLSLKANKTKLLFTILLVAALYMGIMPYLSNVFGSVAVSLSLLSAVAFSSVLLLVVPMFLMGAASPLIISIQTQHTSDSGKMSGLVYSISTLGGIISTFISGFYLIPTFGIHVTLIVFAGLLAGSLLLLAQKKNNFKVLTVLSVLLISGFSLKIPTKNCIYQSDGMLGKINVIDDTIRSATNPSVIRKLLVNNVVQTEMNVSSQNSVTRYIHLLDTNIKTTTSNENALVLGLGGGLTSNMFNNKGYKVDGVELDARIISVAKKYFFLSPSVNAIEEDARRYINLCDKKYKLILIDVFKSEEQPAHVITLESLQKIKSCLTDSAMLMINWHGYLSEEKGKGTAILLNTLKAAGFKYKLCAVTNKEDERNIVIAASLHTIPELNYEINERVSATEIVNTDTKPVLEKYNALANQTWRKNYILYYYSSN